MDVVYPYKARPLDLELRFSIRSLVHVEHSKVIVAGDKPNLRVQHIPVRPCLERYRSSTANILAAAEKAVETDRFIVMNDDIFVLQPWTFRHENRGTIEEYLANGQPQGGYRFHVDTIYLQQQDHSLAAIAARDEQLISGGDKPSEPSVDETPANDNLAAQANAALVEIYKGLRG